MKERPIIFSTEMVEAILNGTKTQTRRVVKPQEVVEYDKLWVHDHRQPHPCEYACAESQFSVCHYGKPGDILWVRESFTVLEPEHCNGIRAERFLFKAGINGYVEEGRLIGIEDGYPYQWKPSIHMPREACRLFLKISDVRVERLQEISDNDAIAEGIGRWIETRLKSQPTHFQYYGDDPDTSYPTDSFESLWDSINGRSQEKQWEANPWVWVITFERIEKEVLNGQKTLWT